MFEKSFPLITEIYFLIISVNTERFLVIKNNSLLKWASRQRTLTNCSIRMPPRHNKSADCGYITSLQSPHTLALGKGGMEESYSNSAIKFQHLTCHKNCCQTYHRGEICTCDIIKVFWPLLPLPPGVT